MNRMYSHRLNFMAVFSLVSPCSISPIIYLSVTSLKLVTLQIRTNGNLSFELAPDKVFILYRSVYKLRKKVLKF